MTDDSAPSLADDEAMLAHYAKELATQLGAIVEPWLKGLVLERAPTLLAEQDIADRVSAAAAAVVDDLDELLAHDIANQRVGPLEILRRAVDVPNEILGAAHVPVPERDDFSTQNFPDDVYDLTPSSFAAVDPALHEPGLIWGAAKAHVHLRRRRES